MKKIFTVLSLLALVISISGCSGGGGAFAGLMGTGTEREAPSDVLKVRSEQIIPSPPLSASSSDGDRNTFTYKFYVENLFDPGQEAGQKAGNTIIHLYDSGRCSLKKGVENNEAKKNKNDIFPGGTKIAKWVLETPTNDELGYVTGKCPLRYQVSYNYEAHTRADAVVATQGRLDEASRTGQPIQISPEETKSRGPIKIDIEFTQDQPFRDEQNVHFTVKVVNKGSGEIQGREIDDDDLDISVGSCDWPGEENTAPFIGKETPPISCSFEAGTGGSPIKTLQVKADIPSYTYVLRDTKKVTVKPVYEPKEIE